MEENPVPIPPAPAVSGTEPIPAMPQNPSLCPQCHKLVTAGESFCPNCGQQLKEKWLSTSVFTQVWIYAVSVLLPPLGFWPGVKYFRSRDPKAQQIGMIAIVLSAVATIATIWLTFAFLNVYLNTFSQVLNGGLYQ